MSATHRMGPERAQPLSLRASDADREAVVSLLRAHATEGRLDADELDQRIGTALRARTRAELAALVEDLPATGPARGSGGRHWRDHLGVYVAVNLMLVAMWALSGFGHPWFVWPLMGWGIGLIAHRRGACGTHRRRARTAVEQAFGVRAGRASAGSASVRQPALER
jgi:uncharacterized protein DUF1707/2TM domain-containing protein